MLTLFALICKFHKEWLTFEYCIGINAEVVTCVAGSLEAVVLPGYPEVLIVEINVMKSWQSLVALYFTH